MEQAGILGRDIIESMYNLLNMLLSSVRKSLALPTRINSEEEAIRYLYTTLDALKEANRTLEDIQKLLAVEKKPLTQDTEIRCSSMDVPGSSTPD